MHRHTANYQLSRQYLCHSKFTIRTHVTLSSFGEPPGLYLENLPKNHSKLTRRNRPRRRPRGNFQATFEIISQRCQLLCL